MRPGVRAGCRGAPRRSRGRPHRSGDSPGTGPLGVRPRRRRAGAGRGTGRGDQELGARGGERGDDLRRRVRTRAPGPAHRLGSRGLERCAGVATDLTHGCRPPGWRPLERCARVAGCGDLGSGSWTWWHAFHEYRPGRVRRTLPARGGGFRRVDLLRRLHGLGTAPTGRGSPGPRTGHGPAALRVLVGSSGSGAEGPGGPGGTAGAGLTRGPRSVERCAPWAPVRTVSPPASGFGVPVVRGGLSSSRAGVTPGPQPCSRESRPRRRSSSRRSLLEGLPAPRSRIAKPPTGRGCSGEWSR